MHEINQTSTKVCKVSEVESITTFLRLWTFFWNIHSIASHWIIQIYVHAH